MVLNSKWDIGVQKYSSKILVHLKTWCWLSIIIQTYFDNLMERQVVSFVPIQSLLWYQTTKPSVIDATWHHQFLTIKMYFMNHIMINIVIWILSWTEINAIKSNQKSAQASQNFWLFFYYKESTTSLYQNCFVHGSDKKR